MLAPIKSSDKFESNMHRTPFANQFLGQKSESKRDLNATQSSSNEQNFDDEHIQLTAGLKSLAIKQQERIYSAGRGFFCCCFISYLIVKIRKIKKSREKNFLNLKN